MRGVLQGVDDRCNVCCTVVLLDLKASSTPTTATSSTTTTTPTREGNGNRTRETVREHGPSTSSTPKTKFNFIFFT